MGSFGGLFLLMALTLGVSAAAIWLQYYLEQKHLAAYQAFCASSGYQFIAERPGVQEDFVRIVPFFNQGYGRRWRHQVSGQYNGVAFSAFQYDYTVSTGRSSATYRHAMIQWSSTKTLPQFTLGPETFFTRIGEVLGFRDIDFDDDPSFSGTYRLKGFDDVPVRALFTPAMRQQLTAIPGQHAAGADSTLFWWHDGALPGPDGFGPFLAAGDQFRAILLQ